MYQIDKLEAFLPLGNQNEYGVTQVAFDISAWQLPRTGWRRDDLRASRCGGRAVDDLYPGAGYADLSDKPG